ncbi:hypothetical protein Q3G72_013132 [Acer saccharum]|nr:hypothetical protein Q3G72_013132 [Acer saccharum]
MDSHPIEQNPEIERTSINCGETKKKTWVKTFHQIKRLSKNKTKRGTIHLLPTFYGKSGEDPHIHIKEFYAVCTTLTNGGVNDERVRLRLFPFSLKDKAKEWLYSLPSGCIRTWVDLAAKFLSKFFPAQRTNKIRKEIMRVQQPDGEPFHEYWERYQRLLNLCLHHFYTIG